jgi:4-amino-4-deoxy-L-arabinose transferase-like glycosyltransferase
MAVILTVALALRLGWALAEPRTPAAIDRLPDQREYLTLADGLLHGRGLRLYDARFGQDVLAYRLPGYPLLVAACGGSVLGVRLLQAALDVGTVAAVFLLGRRLSGRAVGLGAAMWLAVNPLYVYFSGLVLTETAFAAALAWGTYGLARRSTALAASCFAVAVYVRPTAIALGPILAIVSAAQWVVPNRDGRRAYQWRAAWVVPLAIFLTLAPWACRNLQRLGAPIWTTTNDGITLYDGFHDGATGASDQRFLEGLPGLRTMNEVDRSRDLARRARAWAMGHLGELPGLCWRKVARGWSPVPLSAEFGRPLYRWIGGTYAVPFDLCCLLGLCGRRVGWPGKLLLVTPAVVLTAVQVLTVGSIRYRMPAEASLAVLAAAGAADALRWLRGRAGARPKPTYHGGTETQRSKTETKRRQGL